MKNKILVFAKSFLDEPLVDFKTEKSFAMKLDSLKDYEVIYKCTRDHNMELQPQEFDGVVAVIADIEVYDRNILKEIGSKGNGTVELIARYGVGYDTVDLEASVEYGVIVTNCPGSNARPTAEWAVSNILDVAGRRVENYFTASKGEIKKGNVRLDVRGKTLGIIGTGNVGKEVIKIMQGFDVNIIAYSPNPNEDFAKLYNVSYTETPEQVYQSADIISIHAKTDTNEPLIGERELSMMKPTTVLVNCARSYLVDERKAYEFVKEGKIFGYGVDKSWDHRDLPLESLNIIASPHVGSDTDHGKHLMREMSSKAVVDHLGGRKLENIIN